MFISCCDPLVFERGARKLYRLLTTRRYISLVQFSTMPMLNVISVQQDKKDSALEYTMT
jgi:hypothetical protein